MSERIPRFESGATISPGPLATTGSFFQNLAQSFGNVQQVFQKRAFREQIQGVKEQAIRAGQAPGFRQATGGSVATQIFNQVALAANRSAIGADAIERIQMLKNEFGTNITGPGNLHAFTQATNKYIDNELALAPLQNRRFLKNIATNQGVRAANEIQMKITQQTNAIAHRDFIKQHDIYNTHMENAARSGDLNSALAYKGVSDRDTNGLIRLGVISPAYGATLLKASKRNLWTQHAVAQFIASPDKKKYIDDFLSTTGKVGKTFNDKLSPEERQLAVHQMRFLQSQQKKARDAGLGKARTFINGYLKNVSLGSKRDPHKEAQVINEHPELKEEFDRRLPLAEATGAQTKELSGDSISQLTVFVNEHEAARPPVDAADPDSTFRESNRRVLVGIAKQRLKLLKNNPAVAVNSSPAVKLEDNKIKNTTVTADVEADPKLHAAQVNNARQKIDDNHLAHQRVLGVPEESLKLMTNEESSGIAAKLASLPPKDALALMEIQKQRYGKNWPIVARHLQQNGAPQHLMMLTSMFENDQSRPDIPVMIEAFEPGVTTSKLLKDTGVKESRLNSLVKDANAEWTDSLNNYNGPVQGKIEEVNETVARGALALMRKNKHLSLPDAVARSHQDFIGSHYEFPSSKGRSYRLPTKAGVSADSVTTANKALIKSVVNRTTNLAIPKYLGTAFQGKSESERQATYRTDIKTNGYYVTKPDDSGMWLVDGNGHPVLGKDGGQIGYNFSDITNPDSLINGIISAQKPLPISAFPLQIGPIFIPAQAVGTAMKEIRTVRNLFRRIF